MATIAAGLSMTARKFYADDDVHSGCARRSYAIFSQAKPDGYLTSHPASVDVGSGDSFNANRLTRTEEKSHAATLNFRQAENISPTTPSHWGKP